MATPSSLPGVTSTIEDFGLQVAPEPQVLNDSILIIGTAEDGPMYEPIPITSKDGAQKVFGAFGQGTLIRGVHESMDATLEGTPDIRAMRIGNGEKAKLEIAERLSSSSPWDEKTTGNNSLKLEAVYPGSKYNAVSIFLDEKKRINVYNPKTGLYSQFTYDDTNPYNSTVDARNVQELVDAINADSNASQVVVASTSGIATQFEIQVNAASSGCTVTNGKLTLDLKTVLAGYDTITDVLATGYIFEADTSSTAGNLLDELDEVFSISVSEPVLLETKGVNSVTAEYTPFDGKGDARFDTIQALEDYDADNIYFTKPSGGASAVVSEYMCFLENEVLPDVTVAATGLMQFSAELSAYGWFLAPDDSQEVKVSASGSNPKNGHSTKIPWVTVTDKDGNSASTSGTWASCLALAAARASSGNYFPYGYTLNNIDNANAVLNDYVYITASGFASKLENAGKVIIEMSDTGGTDDSEWTDLLYHPVSGIYVSGFVVSDGTGTATLAIGWNATGYLGTGSLVNAGLITSSGSTEADKYLRMTCNTVKGFLTEAESLPAMQSNTDDWLSYFFRGKELLFSDTVPFDIIANYGIKINYEPGSDVMITDSTNGQVKFAGSLQPGPAGGALDATKKSIIGLKYVYLPQFPSITTAAQSLDGGTNGTEMDNEELYDEFASAYEKLENYEAQIVVPMGANLDATKGSYNAITGLPETVNAQFQVQFAEFLDKLSTNVKECIGVMGVETAISDSMANVNDWVKRLTVMNLSDPTRGANVMPLLNSKHIQVATFEPVFENLGGLPYTANGQAAYAGLISSLEPHYSPTNKSLPNAYRTRFNLSNSQLEAMSSARYVSMRRKPGKTPVITDAVTAAAPGSDFVRLTTVRITFAAMDVVRKVCDPFIGQPNTQAKRNAMEAAITKGLSALVDVGALRKYAFTISSSTTQQVLGIVDVELILVPIFEIKRIRATVKLRTEIPSNA